MLAPHERRLLFALALILAAGAAADWISLHRPREAAWLVGPARVSALQKAGESPKTEASPESAAAAPGPRRARSGKPRRTAAYLADGRLDLNAADSADLVALKGVGPSLAGRILAERRKRGRFAAVDDLTRVRGIGPKTLERLRIQVAIPGSKDSFPDTKDSTRHGR